MLRQKIRMMAEDLKGKYDKKALSRYTREELLAVIYNLIYVLSDDNNYFTALVDPEIAAVHILSDVGLFDIQVTEYKSLLNEELILKGKIREVHK